MVYIKLDSVNGFSFLSRELDRHAQCRQTTINTKGIIIKRVVEGVVGEYFGFIDLLNSYCHERLEIT